MKIMREGQVRRENGEEIRRGEKRSKMKEEEIASENEWKYEEQQNKRKIL